MTGKWKFGEFSKRADKWRNNNYGLNSKACKALNQAERLADLLERAITTADHNWPDTRRAIQRELDKCRVTTEAEEPTVHVTLSASNNFRPQAASSTAHLPPGEYKATLEILP